MLSLEQCSKKKFLVFGLGVSGHATLSQLKKNKANIECWDDSKQLREKFKNKYRVNKNWFKSSYDFIVISPGINIYSHSKKLFFYKNKNKIITDLDLFCSSIKDQKVIMVTGTNGKSTMCKLIYDLLKNSKKKVYLGGNYGTPVLDLPYKEKSAIFVLELSSYQLDYSSRLPSSVSILLNISPDHLERHQNFSKYISAKLKIFKGLEKTGIGFLDLSSDKQSKIFNILKSEKYNQKNIELIKKNIHHNIKDNLISLPLRGLHFKNCLYIALQIAKLFKISKNVYLKTIKDFKGLPHRQEIIKVKNNITFINDSKATNFSSTEVALNSYKNIHWILGGLAKAKDRIIVSKFKKSILRAYIIGKNINFFLKQIKSTVKHNTSHTLKNALLSALRESKNYPSLKQVILLSPSAASFDQYKNFEHRGNTFKQLVKKYS
ncbi:MAG: UDP-N-acetylmuramoyl-L-alanine--D-glutamate ligase [Candidatus Fonsibacter sp.]|jgi:UDP-N-acetylmuramoylalanine--D-glutamate ligase|nr:UDP-N-acetylmuramoyl-L-alanine--D-glutamate ligase [Candidatus Fonsibacter sp.]